MDLKRATGGSGEVWTEERHASFLNWMEESFVTRMLNRSKGSGGVGRQRRSRLDRHIPDSATESTCDSRFAVSGAIRKHGAGRSPPAADQETGELAVRSRDTKRKLSPQRYEASEDQVVPELGGKEMHGG